LVERKAAVFARLLSPEALPHLSEENARAVLRSVFSTRRRADVILSHFTVDGLIERVGALIWGGGPVGDRLAVFHEAVAEIGRGVPTNTGYDLGSELLHFTMPEQHWLWTRWMWDPETETGALPLVLTEEVDLTGADIAETYRRIGLAVAFIDEVGKAAGLRETGHGPFDNDLFLASVYVIYVYTTLRMRMTQEFNRVVPEFGELLRRFLGVHRSPLLEEVPA
jgi:hypothetical protein